MNLALKADEVLTKERRNFPLYPQKKEGDLTHPSFFLSIQVST